VPDPVDVVRRLGGRARTGDVLSLCTRTALTQTLTEGRLVRPGRGVLVLPGLPDPEVAAARAGGVLSHLTAAERLRLSLVRVPDVVHVTVPHGARPAPQEGVRVHWSVAPVETDEAGIATSGLRTVMDCATVLPFDEALAVADSALYWTRIMRTDLLAAAEASSRTGRRRRIRIAENADGRSANAFESRLRAIVLGAGWTGFEPQFAIPLESRTVRVDLADPLARVVLEADSFAHHGTRDALRRDCERYDELVADGWVVLRFAWEHVMFQPAWVARVVDETCRRRRPLVRYGQQSDDRRSSPSRDTPRRVRGVARA
jgi:very-short-patch-repair endonuclease